MALSTKESRQGFSGKYWDTTQRDVRTNSNSVIRLLMSARTLSKFAGLESGTARLARIVVFGPDEVAVLHVMNRFVRRCFLFGDDPASAKTSIIERSVKLHRRGWCELVANFGKRFFHVAGDPTTIDTTQSRLIQYRYYAPRETRKIFHGTKRPATT